MTTGESVHHPFAFRGTAGEYFRIWIVNIALTVVTLGIYSAWAKVRRERYFAGNTSVAGNAFSYHGEPRAILKGRLIAGALFVLYVVAGQVSPIAGLLAALALMAAMPWLIVRSMMFRLHMTAWRGLRFSFRSDYAGAYRVFLGWSMLASITFGLLLPKFLYKRQQYTVTRSAYAATPFEFEAPPGAFTRAGFLALAMLVAGMVLAFAGFGGLALVSDQPAALLAAPVWLYGVILVTITVVGAYLNARIQNATLDSLVLGPHRFSSRLSARRLVSIQLTNLLAIVATLGLAIPWARIRSTRYRVESLTLEAHGSLDEFVAAQAGEGSTATGEAIGELFDVDFATG